MNTCWLTCCGGGHTKEILAILAAVLKNHPERGDWRYVFKRTATDHYSTAVMENFGNQYDLNYSFAELYPVREPNGSLIKGALLVAWYFVYQLSVLLLDPPQQVIAHAHGSSLSLLFAAALYNLTAFAIKFLGILLSIRQLRDFTTIDVCFIESICRQETMSITGKVVYTLGLGNKFIVFSNKIKKPRICLNTRMTVETINPIAILGQNR